MVNEAANEIFERLIEIRRHLHSIPELENEEFETSKYIISILEELGIEYEMVLPTGICALIKGKRGEGKTIAIRADIDALPITELNDIDYKSKNIGVMHACGHDVHITCALGVAMILKKLNYDFYGNVKLIFQPAEEGSGGALQMIDNGILSNPSVDAAISLHTEPLCSVGTLQYRDGAIMASPDDFYVKIIGKGGHGAYPDKCINPIYAAAEFISKIKTIVKDNFDKSNECVVSICTANAGTLNNIIPDFVEITGTARSLNNIVRDKIEKLIEDHVKDICNEYSCKYEYKFNRLYPPLINDKKINKTVIEAAKKINGINEISEQSEPSMTGDDFSYFAQKVPSSYFKLGTANDNINTVLHSAHFNVDERALKLGTAVFAQAALDYLNTGD